MAFAERVAGAMTLEEAAAVRASEGFGGEIRREVARLRQFVRRELLSHRVAQSDQEVPCERVQIAPKEVGPETVLAQTVGVQTTREFLVAILTLAGHRRFGGPVYSS